jgi:hypothetical protein
MAKKAGTVALSSNSNHRHHPAPAAWRAHLDSIKVFHGFTPMPKQQRSVMVVDQRPLPDNQPAVFSMRNTVTQFRLSGTSVEDSVEDIVRTLPILKPSLSVASSVHDIVLLTADFLELQRLRMRCSLPQESGGR